MDGGTVDHPLDEYREFIKQHTDSIIRVSIDGGPLVPCEVRPAGGELVNQRLVEIRHPYVGICRIDPFHPSIVIDASLPDRGWFSHRTQIYHLTYLTRRQWKRGLHDKTAYIQSPMATWRARLNPEVKYWWNWEDLEFLASAYETPKVHPTVAVSKLLNLECTEVALSRKFALVQSIESKFDGFYLYYQTKIAARIVVGSTITIVVVHAPLYQEVMDWKTRNKLPWPLKT